MTFKNLLLPRTTGPISNKLQAQSILWWSTNEGPHPFPMGDNYKEAKIHWRNLKIFFFRTIVLISTKLGTKHHLVNMKYLPLFPGEMMRKSEITLIRSLKIFVSSITGPISTKLGTKHLLVKWRATSSPRGDNNKIVKLHYQNLKNILHQNHGLFQPNLAQTIIWWIGFKFIQMKCPFQGRR